MILKGQFYLNKIKDFSVNQLFTPDNSRIKLINSILKILIKLYLIDVDDGGRRNIVDKLFSEYTWHTFHNKITIIITN